MNMIRIHDLAFEPYITAQEIDHTVTRLAAEIDRDYKDLDPVLMIILNGAFVFASDLVRRITIPIRLDFAKLSSYAGTASSGAIREHFLWETPLEGRHVIIIEDIVDTGHTLRHLKEKIGLQHPASVETACLLMKPDAYTYTDPVRYCGIQIPNDFVVGYGLDYDGLGRDLDCIYKVKG